jgi:DNA-binding NarL/FixJ family response regulator
MQLGGHKSFRCLTIAIPVLYLPVAHASQSGRVAVCLLSTHSLVLQEMQRVLIDAPFALQPTKLAGQEKESQALPSADVYVIDSESAPGGVAQLVKQIVASNPNAQMLVLGADFNEANAFPLLNMGVKGLITHEAINQQLTRALEAISTGGFWVPRTLLATFVDSVISKSRKSEAAKGSPVEISRREREIIDNLLLNLSNKEIANKLNISERTVKFHVSNLLSKFNVQRRADLMLLWYQQGAHEGDPPNPAGRISRRVQ